MKIIVVCGYFDPYHSGHADYIAGAAEHGKVWILLNSDAAALRKKDYCFSEWSERAKVLMSIKGVEMVIPVDDSDGTVCKGIEYIKSLGVNMVFAKGGDRGPDNTPEKELCDMLGIEILWGCGGGKTQSSSELVKRAREYQKLTPLIYEDKT